jgi:hypothetical protein
MRELPPRLRCAISYTLVLVLDLGVLRNPPHPNARRTMRSTPWTVIACCALLPIVAAGCATKQPSVPKPTPLPLPLCGKLPRPVVVSLLIDDSAEAELERVEWTLTLGCENRIGVRERTKSLHFVQQVRTVSAPKQLRWNDAIITNLRVGPNGSQFTVEKPQQGFWCVSCKAILRGGNPTTHGPIAVTAVENANDPRFAISVANPIFKVLRVRDLNLLTAPFPALGGCVFLTN